MCPAGAEIARQRAGSGLSPCRYLRACEASALPLSYAPCPSDSTDSDPGHLGGAEDGLGAIGDPELGVDAL